MDKHHVKVKIDANGNVHREIIEEPVQAPERPKLLKRIATAFNFSSA